MDDLDEKRENFRSLLEERQKNLSKIYSDLERAIAEYRAKVKELETKDDEETED